MVVKKNKKVFEFKEKDSLGRTASDLAIELGYQSMLELL